MMNLQRKMIGQRRIANSGSGQIRNHKQQERLTELRGHRINRIILVLSLIAIASLTGCNEVNLQSKWRDKPIALDGSIVGWPDDVQYFDENTRTLFSIVNDADDLYIRIVTRSKTTQRLMMGRGFTVWLDDSGGTDKKFGIQFPLARQGRMQTTFPDHKSRTGMEEMLADSRNNLAILQGSEGKRQTMPVQQAQSSGIYASLNMHRGILVYVLKVSIPPASSGGIVGIGFESGKPERSAGRGGSGGGSGGGKGGGRGGGHGGGMGGGGGGGGKSNKGGQQGGGQPQAVDIWARVHLATNPEEPRG